MPKGKHTTFRLVTTHEVGMDSAVLAAHGVPCGSVGRMRVTREFEIDDRVMTRIAKSLKTDKSVLLDVVRRITEAFVGRSMPMGKFGPGFDIGEILGMGERFATMPSPPTPPPSPRPAGPRGGPAQSRQRHRP